ncbi:universal stress protein [Mycobacterium sp. NPDC050551]|uniref:universal stress protein n=1 Tax=Mycobacterium sp. NPDC050551 TaxID=3155407 RepID=UPI003434EC3F
MNDPLGPVLVGLDGSLDARSAVAWAATEALALEAPLRLIHVVDDSRRPPTHDCLADALADLELITASAASSISVVSSVLRGDPLHVLAEESRSAAMVCVGAGGRGPGSAVGAVSTALAESAHCPVAIIRHENHLLAPEDGVIAVVLDDEPDNDAVVRHAMQEGRIRRTDVVQIDRRVDSWVRRYPDVHVETVAAGSATGYAHTHASRPTKLAVVGRREGKGLGGPTSPNCHDILGYPNYCSILVVRD